ncbi:MAG TPA: hypothetical protein PK715_13840, partial [Chitinophagales bacterium]|nr:hypothetical protein [Chitinophagales bacterium]
MTLQLKILRQDLFDEYKKYLKVDIDSALAYINKKLQAVEDFKFYLANAAVHSSNIEGNTVSFDTYLKASEFNLHLKTKEIKEIEDLIAAYQYARENELTLNNILKVHEILIRSILVKKERGKIRKVKVGVRSEGRLIYLAVEPEFVKEELTKLFADISLLLQTELTATEVFYYAAY